MKLMYKKHRSDSPSLLELENRLVKAHGKKLTMLSFENVHKGTFKCSPCGHIWEADCSAVWRGNGCPNCYEKVRGLSCRFSYSYVSEYVKENDCFLISKEYKNTKTKIEIRFSCGHVGKISFDSFRSGRRCYICGQERSHKSQRMSESQISDSFSKHGVLDFVFPSGYKNRNSVVEYSCKNGHFNRKKLSLILEGKICKTCSYDSMSVNQTGKLGNNWQGGKTTLRRYFKKLGNAKWKKESAENCDYKCIITGDRFDDIHHLFPFSEILNQALKNLNLNKMETVSEYSDGEIEELYEEIIRMQSMYPLGVCLRRDVHKLFHKLYGLTKCTEQDFYEFARKVKSGEITIKKIKNRRK